MAVDKITELRDLLVRQSQNLPAYQALPPFTKGIINEVIEKTSGETAIKINDQVEQLSNKQINEITQQTIGPINPLDIVNGNLSTSDVSKVLAPIASDQFLKGFENDFAFKIANELNNKLPPSLRGLIDINTLVTSITSSGAISQGINSAVSNYSSELFNSNNIVTPFVNNALEEFTKDPSKALENINKSFDNQISSNALNEAKRFNIKDSENQQKLLTQTKGFIDPHAEYPTKDYKGQPETNKLARGDLIGTIVQAKEKDRLKGISLPYDDFWDQPPIPYNAKYPYNKVTQTESGHVIEIDDTHGAERIHLYHKSGTFIEIDANGTVVTRKKGSSYEIIDKNGYISVSGDASLSVRGGVKIFVGEDADIEVQGDVNLKCLNDITMQAAGRVDISATEEINFRSANINIEADVDLSFKGDKNILSSTTDYYVKANNNSYHQSVNNYYVYANKNLYNQALGEIHLKSTGTLNADGSEVHLNSDKASDSNQSKLAYSANIGLIGTRKDIVYESITDPVSCNYLDEVGYKSEDIEIPSELKKEQEKIEQLGIAKASDLNESAVAIESETPRSNKSQIIRPDDSLLQQTYLPDNYQLSKNFTLGDLSSKAVVTKNAVQTQVGLTYGQIVFNLGAIALNVLEPLIALYPKAKVTSAFRLASGSSSTSQHPKGQAVDIQIPGLSKSEYYEVAKKLSTQLNYDQLLLEYKNYGTGLPWIHISFNVDSPRKTVMTFFNDKKYSDGLTNLA